MNTVHWLDIEVVEVIKPNLQNGPWIAGGAALKWYNNESVGTSDIDVFCRDKQQADKVTKRFAQAFTTVRNHESDNALTLSVAQTKKPSIFGSTFPTTVDLKSTWNVQIITHDFYENMEAVIDRFDITVCQIATAGDEWIMCDNTAKDIRERNLRMILPLRKSSAKRLLKYWSYGYRPVDGLVESMDKEVYFEKTVKGDYGF
jgi:hypothetical protein